MTKILLLESITLYINFKQGDKMNNVVTMNLLALANVKSYNPKDNEEYMNNAQLEHFRVILTVWKKQILEESTKTVLQMQTDISNFPDPIDRASQEEELNLILRNRDRERRLLNRINTTLVNLDEGEFGYCKSCGDEIGIKRLEARPIAELCLNCKMIAEHKEKHMFK